MQGQKNTGFRISLFTYHCISRKIFWCPSVPGWSVASHCRAYPTDKSDASSQSSRVRRRPRLWAWLIRPSSRITASQAFLTQVSIIALNSLWKHYTVVGWSQAVGWVLSDALILVDLFPDGSVELAPREVGVTVEAWALQADVVAVMVRLARCIFQQIVLQHHPLTPLGFSIKR